MVTQNVLSYHDIFLSCHILPWLLLIAWHSQNLLTHGYKLHISLFLVQNNTFYVHGSIYNIFGHLNNSYTFYTSNECAQISSRVLFLFINPFSTRPHQNAFWYNNSWVGFLKILNYVPKEREKFSAENEPSFVTVKCCDGS